MVAPHDSDSATVRTTFFIDPQGVIRVMTCYPANVGRSTPEMIRTHDALPAVDNGPVLEHAHWKEGVASLPKRVGSTESGYLPHGKSHGVSTETKLREKQ